MKCPLDGNELKMTDRNGVEIDYCPKCRGVWLDRGELDKIIERSGAQTTSQPAQTVSDRDHRMDDDGYASEKPRKKRRDSFLGDLFDF